MTCIGALSVRHNQRVSNKNNIEFSVQVGIHQDFILNPLLFIIVLAMTEEVALGNYCMLMIPFL